MIDLLKHAENIRKKLAGISGLMPQASPTPAPVTPSNVIAARFAAEADLPPGAPGYAAGPLATAISPAGKPVGLDTVRTIAREFIPAIRPANALVKPAVLPSNVLLPNVLTATRQPYVPHAPVDTSVLDRVVASQRPGAVLQPNQPVDLDALVRGNNIKNPALNVLERKQQLAQIGGARR